MMFNSKRQDYLWTLVVGILFAALIPLVVSRPMALELLLFGALAYATAFLTNVAGLPSLVQGAFFGIGAYVAGFMQLHGMFTLIPLLGTAIVIAGLVALIVGYISIHSSGFYFLMITFAFCQLFYYLGYSLPSITGGEDGLTGYDYPSLFPLLGDFWTLSKYNLLYVVTTVLFLIILISLKIIKYSVLGRVLNAAQFNDQKIEVIGYSVKFARTTIFGIIGGMAGACGVLYAFIYGIVPMDTLGWFQSAIIIMMVIIGGTDDILGALAGALVFIWLQDQVSQLWARWPLLFGIIVIIIVLGAQRGILGLIIDMIKGRGWRKTQ